MIDFCYNLPGNAYLDKLMLGISWFGNGVVIPVVITILIALIFMIFNKKRFALAIIAAPLVGNILKSILKDITKRSRPGWEGCRSLVHLTDYSFPSGHTIFYTIIFGLLAFYGFKYLWDKWYGKAIFIISCGMIIMVGISRVYLGAHFITDVLAGYVIGGIILTSTIYLLNKYPDKK